MSRQKVSKGPWDDFFDYGPRVSKDFLLPRIQPPLQTCKRPRKSSNQYAQLVEIARRLGAHTDEETFKRAIQGIVKERPPKGQ
jgi:hypothetical protein